MKLIRTLEALEAAALARRSVICPPPAGRLGRPEPAAWVISMQARIVLRMIRTGLYLYCAPPRPRRKHRFPDLHQSLVPVLPCESSTKLPF